MHWIVVPKQSIKVPAGNKTTQPKQGRWAMSICSLSIDIKRQKIDYLRFLMCPLLASKASFHAAINSTNEANKAGGTRH